MKSRIFILILIAHVFSSSLFAQAIIKGVVTNELNEPITGATLSVGNQGSTTDIDGQYTLSLPIGIYQLKIRYLGYQELNINLELTEENNYTYDFKLTPMSTNIDVVVVSGSKYEKKLTEETVSIDVITPNIIERNNTTTLSDVVERVPGVQILDGQVNIRSGSGYAYGAGSRVLLLVDEMPMLSGELSDIKWNFIPIENAQQIEVIKGAASVFYGSSALNGVINVRTAFPSSDKAYTSLSSYAGVFSAPQNNRKWWGNKLNEQPFQSGIFFAHRQKLNENNDLVIGSNIHWLRSPLKGADEHRMRANFKWRHRPPTNENISLGINANVMYHELGNFFLWKGQDSLAFVHINDPFGTDNYISYSIDPYLTYFDKNKNKHEFKLRAFGISKQRGIEENSNGYSYVADYQFQRNFDSLDLTTSFGINHQYAFAKSILFETLDSLGSLATQGGSITALYGQLEKKFFNDKLSLIAGIRTEYLNGANQNSIKDTILIDSTFTLKKNKFVTVFRAGVNYQLSNSDFLRASFGQGYRLPSLAERYIRGDITPDLHVFPNPQLSPESGWSAEFGYKKAFQKTWINGFFDASIFWMEYKNMVEFYFNLYPPDNVDAFSFDPNHPNYIGNFIGFKSLNVSRARIAGTEFSFNGETRIGNLPIRIWAGYTYTFPGDLSRDSSLKKIDVFLGNTVNAFFNQDEEIIQGILKYRSLHTARIDLESSWKKFTLGTAANFNSFVHNIDEVLTGEGPLGPLVVSVLGGKPIVSQDFRQQYKNGNWIFDLRLAYQFNEKNKLHFIINNLTNREYFLRDAKMNPTRLFTLKYNRTF